MTCLDAGIDLTALPVRSLLRRIWTKVAVPLLVAAGVAAAIVLALVLSHGVPGLSPLLAAMTAGVAGLRLWQRWPRPRMVVHWCRAGARGAPLLRQAAPGREAGAYDYASWTAMLVATAGLMLNTLLAAFGSPGLPFDHSGASFAAFFALLCIGLYSRP